MHSKKCRALLPFPRLETLPRDGDGGTVRADADPDFVSDAQCFE